LVQQVGNQFHRTAFAQGGEQPFLGAGIPEPVERVTDLSAGKAEANVFGGDVFHRVGLVEDDKVVAEHDPALGLFFDSAQEREEKGMIQNENVGGKNAVAGALEEANLVLLGVIGLIAAGFGRARPRSEQTWDQTFWSGSMSKSDRLPSVVDFDHS